MANVMVRVVVRRFDHHLRLLCFDSKNGALESRAERRWVVPHESNHSSGTVATCENRLTMTVISFYILSQQP